MRLAAVFLLIFLGGPFLFRLLTKAAPSRRGLRQLAMLTGVFIVVGVGLRYSIGNAALWRSMASLLMVWFAWIGALAFGAQALRLRDTSGAMRRWTGVIGALGTTVPWFGLAFAEVFWGG